MRARWILVGLVVGCGSGWDGPDARVPPPPDGPLPYHIDVTSVEPLDRPPPAVPPQVFIDGVARTILDVGYPDFVSLAESTHTVELRAGDIVVRSVVAPDPRTMCPDTIAGYTLQMCSFDSGDLRIGYIGVDQCHDYVDCEPCFGSCPGERCTSRATSLDPFFSHLACAPIGPRAEGEACTWIADADGAYDDCAEDLLCVDGTCRSVCGDGPCPTSCTYVPGHAPELRVCP